jgi:hypothetical protein
MPSNSLDLGLGTWDLGNERIMPETHSGIGSVPTALPKVWVGFFIAAFFIMIKTYEIAKDKDFAYIRSLIFLAGLIYSLYCVYRLHQVIAGCTNSSHPITPRQAVAYHFIPLYNIYWIFKWPNEIDKFVNSRGAPGQMVKGLASFFLLGGLLLGIKDGGICLTILFGVELYLARKIRRAITFPGEGPIDYTGRLLLALRAATGAVCLMIITLAVVGFWEINNWWEPVSIVVGIGLVFLFILVFLQPLRDLFLKSQGLYPQREIVPHGNKFLRSLVFAVVFITGVFHALLEEEISNGRGLCIWLISTKIIAANDCPIPDVYRIYFFSFMFVSMLIAVGSITYGWMVGVRRHRFRAKWIGAFFGFMVGASIGMGELGFGQIPPELLIGFIIGTGSEWALPGFVGGWAVDRGWGSRPMMIGLFLIGIILLTNIPRLLFWHYSGHSLVLEAIRELAKGLGIMAGSDREMMINVLLDIARALGWMFGLWADPQVCKLLGGECREVAFNPACP